MAHPKRTPKTVILTRLFAVPTAVLLFWAFFLNLADSGLAASFLVGGLVAVALAVGFCWAFTNIVMAIWSPRAYKLWKKGGGDPYFDTVDPPFNTDPSHVRYKELFDQQLRQDVGDFERHFGIQRPQPEIKEGKFFLD